MIPYYTVSGFDLGFITIQPWGIMVAIGILVASFWLIHQAKKEKFDLNKLQNLIIIIIIAGIISARIFDIIFYSGLSSMSFFDYFKFWSGGLSFLGGFIGAFLGALWYTNKHKLKFWKTADLFAPAIALGHSIARIGCFITGLHIGKVTTMPWGVLIGGEVRHQTALYSIIYLFIIFLILVKLRTKKLFVGFVFLAYLILYSIARFTNDLFRVDPAYFGLTLTQYSLIIVFSLAVFFIYKKTNGFRTWKE